MQEVKTVISMPKFDSKKASFNMMGDYSKAEMSPAVVESLREYVTVIASLYRGNNPFHNFEHAWYVSSYLVFS